VGYRPVTNQPKGTFQPLNTPLNPPGMLQTTQ